MAQLCGKPTQSPKELIMLSSWILGTLLWRIKVATSSGKALTIQLTCCCRHNQWQLRQSWYRQISHTLQATILCASMIVTFFHLLMTGQIFLIFIGLTLTLVAGWITGLVTIAVGEVFLITWGSLYYSKWQHKLCFSRLGSSYQEEINTGLQW